MPIDKNMCVIIPVHKSKLSLSEKTSLLQCKKVLIGYSVFLVFPQGLHIDDYIKLYPSILPFEVPNEWLSSIEAYNMMKRSLDFYRLFDKFDYMLTYELDAYIFSDNWNIANCFGYDYIGAPWFEGYNEGSKKIMGVGNSGFSMRNIKSCLRILKKREQILGLWALYSKLKLNKIIRLSLLLRLFDSDWNVECNNYYFIPLTSAAHINEDIFWGSLVPQVFKFKIASIANSIKFSFEINPSELLKRNNFQLPIGCHAWEKYEPEFWANYIN